MDASPSLDHVGGSHPAAAVRHATHEAANALTHGVGALAALISGAILVGLAADGDGWQLTGAIVFALCLFLLYFASTLYHSARSPGAKARLKVFDHCAIYLLIAGTYTPFTLTALRGTLGWSLFAAIWTLAFAGIVFKLFYTGRFKKLSTGVYIAMGWLAIFAIRPLMQELDSVTLRWILAGGVIYTVGTVFYLRNSRFAHAIWHLFCIGGSLCHYIAVLRVVTPSGVT